MDIEFSGNLYCLVVETARSSSTLNTLHIRSLFEQHFPGTKTLLYNGEIIVLLCMPKPTPLSDQNYQQIRDICSKHGLYAGISNVFTNIVQLTQYYKQGLRAIELGIGLHNNPGLFIYQDYYLQHMTNIFVQKESSDTFCHPKLKTLLNYDKRHDTQLAYTLYMYLISERNIADAAEAMFIHRNTIVYRVKKINSLVTINYDSYQERQYLILSYELYKSGSS